MATDLTGTITNAAASGFAEAETEAGRAKAHSLPDLIAADRYLAAKAAAASPGRGLRFTKLLPPGQIGNINSGGDV